MLTMRHWWLARADFLPKEMLLPNVISGKTVKSNESHRIVVDVVGEGEDEHELVQVAARSGSRVAANTMPIDVSDTDDNDNNNDNDDDDDDNNTTTTTSDKTKKSVSAKREPSARVSKKTLRAKHRVDKRQPAPKKPVSR